MNDKSRSASNAWKARPPGKRYTDAGPTLEAIERLMDGLLIPPPMKELIQILMAQGILQPEQAEKTAGDIRKTLPPDQWREVMAAQADRLR